MKCPYCLHLDTKVVDKRDSEGKVRRRRECLSCEKRFNTLETPERAELRVIKKDGRREPFVYEKLKKGVMKAFEKRPIPMEKIEKMLNNIEEKLRRSGKEVKTSFIGDLVARGMKRLDKIAYIRFASVYHDFSEIDDFRREIRGLLKRR